MLCCCKKALSNKVLQCIFIATQPSSHIKGSRALKKSMLGSFARFTRFFQSCEEQWFLTDHVEANFERILAHLVNLAKTILNLQI